MRPHHPTARVAGVPPLGALLAALMLGMSCTSDPGSTYDSYWTQVFGRQR